MRTSDRNGEARVQPGFKGTSTEISKEYRTGNAAAQVPFALQASLSLHRQTVLWQIS
jgi:hypothetical protein